MHYTGLTYRPPYEANSLILQVTSGCSHNRCTFCTMYRDVPFAVSPIEEVEADLREAARSWPWAQRVFLANGDAFCLPASRLEEIAQLIHRYLPEVRSIGGYASIKNIRTKSVGSNNPINMVKATMNGLKQLRNAEEIAKLRGKTVEELLG